MKNTVDFNNSVKKSDKKWDIPRVDPGIQNLRGASDWIMEHCPACYETLKPAALDCTSCGIVLENFRKAATEKRLKLTIGGLYHLTGTECMELEKSWSKIESVYYDSELHSQFLYLCFRLKSLPYAVKMYNQRLAQDPLDDIASTMKRRAMALASESLPGSSIEEKWLPSVLVRSLLRTMMVVLILGVCGGSVMMLTSVLTSQPFYFLAMGSFVTGASLLSLLLLRRLPQI